MARSRHFRVVPPPTPEAAPRPSYFAAVVILGLVVWAFAFIGFAEVVGG